MSYEPHEIALRDWVVLATGLADERVFFAGQQAAPPRPDLTYATVLVLGEAGADSNAVGLNVPLGAGYTLDITTYERGTVSVQIFGPSSRALMARLAKSFKVPAVQELFTTTGVWPTLAGSGGLVDAFAVLSTSFEPRTSQDFVFTFTRSDVHEVGAIEQVTITGAVQ